MDKQIQVPSGLFGHETTAYVRDNGDIYVNEGLFGTRTVGTWKPGDGIYVSDGLFHERKVLDIDSDGVIRDMDATLFGKGSYLGEIRHDGSLYDSDRSYAGRITGWDDGSLQTENDTSALARDEANHTWENVSVGSGVGAPSLGAGTILLILLAILVVPYFIIGVLVLNLENAVKPWAESRTLWIPFLLGISVSVFASCAYALKGAPGESKGLAWAVSLGAPLVATIVLSCMDLKPSDVIETIISCVVGLLSFYIPGAIVLAPFTLPLSLGAIGLAKKRQGVYSRKERAILTLCKHGTVASAASTVYLVCSALSIFPQSVFI